MNNQVNTLYFESSLFYNESDLTRAVRNLSENITNTIKELSEVEIRFYNTDLEYYFAVAKFEAGKLIDNAFIANKSQSKANEERITHQLKDIINLDMIGFQPVKFMSKSLCQYFSNISENNYKISEYKRHKDFITEFVRLDNEIKAVDSTANFGFQSNQCAFGADIPKNVLKRSLDEKLLPFHKLIIDYDTVQKSIDKFVRKIKKLSLFAEI